MNGTRLILNFSYTNHYKHVDVLFEAKKKKKKKKKSKNAKSKKNDKTILSSKCATCASRKSRFTKKQEEKGLLSSLGI